MLYPIHEKGGSGYIDRKGNVVVEPVHYYVHKFNNGVGKIYNQSYYSQNGVYEVYLVNTKGKTVFSLKTNTYVTVSFVAEGFAVVETSDQKGDNCQYYGFDGEPAFTNIYEKAEVFSYGLAAVKIDGKWGYINKKGELVINAVFDTAGHFFSENSAIVVYDEKWGVIDQTGQFTVSPKYSLPIVYYPDPHFPNTPFLLTMQKHENEHDNKYSSDCFIDISGKQIFPGTFMRATCFFEGLSRVGNENGKYGYINRKGKLVIPYQFDRADIFSEGLASVKTDGKWGYINRSGKVVFSTHFDIVYDFHEGRAKVKIGEKFGYINKSGKLVIPVQFDSAEDFRGGLADVGIGDEYGYDEYGYIDKKGRFVWKTKGRE